MIKCSMISGSMIEDIELPAFTTCAVRDYLGVSQQDLDDAKAQGYDISAEMLTHQASETGRQFITYHDSDGAATFFVL